MKLLGYLLNGAMLGAIAAVVLAMLVAVPLLLYFDALDAATDSGKTGVYPLIYSALLILGIGIIWGAAAGFRRYRRRHRKKKQKTKSYLPPT